MPLAHRIIPTILCRGRQLVKGKGFDSWRSVGIAIQAAKIHARRGVDEVCILDIDATKEGRLADLDLVRELAEDFFIPIAVGGGVRTVNDVKSLLHAGADSIVIGTGALETDVVREASRVVGNQAITVSIDVKQGRVWKRCGTVPMDSSPSTPLEPERWAAEVAQAGAGEILLQSIERDGTGVGYDLALIKAVHNAVRIPIIASGGAGNYQHMVEAIQAGAAAVASGAMFQFEDATPRGAALFLQKAGVEVRIP